jgi:response regulator NasT
MNSEAIRVAVADDESDMRDYFSRMLPRLGHIVVSVADNGRQLVEDCRTHRPDLVITDVRMPELDGLAAAVQLAGELALRVILVSAHLDPRGSRGGGIADSFVFLEKPINMRKLEAGIAAAFASDPGA